MNSGNFDAKRQRAIALLTGIRAGRTFDRLRNVAQTCDAHGAAVRLWAEELGLVVWHNRRSGTMVGHAEARASDERFMKETYG